MNAVDLLEHLRGTGFRLDVDGDSLLVTPGARLTDDDRTVIRAHKPELVALLTGRATPPATARNRPYRLAPADADRCHAGGWDDAEIARFVARVGLFMRRAIDATDADDLAERLTLRDREADPRVICAECRHYRPGRCGNHHAAQLSTADVGRDLATLLQRCPGFDSPDLARAP